MKHLKLFALIISIIVIGLRAQAQAPPPPVCEVPKVISTTSITQTTALLSWHSVSGSDHYQIAYGLTSNSLHMLTTKDTTIQLTGLTSGTEYYWEVETFCPQTGTTVLMESGYSSLTGFKTAAPPLTCNPPRTLELPYNVTQTSATFKWTKVTGACSYIMTYYAYVTPKVIDTIKTQDSIINVQHLLPGTYYHWNVQTVCCGGSKSVLSSTQLLTTLAPPACNAPLTAQTTKIGQTSAVFSWSIVEGACSYTGLYYAVNNSSSLKTFSTTYTSFTASPLLPGTSYHWMVKTVCCSGNTSSSYQSQSFVTEKSPPPACQTPAHFSFDNSTTTGCTIHWNKIASACSYNIKYFQYTAAGTNPPDTLTATTKDSSYIITRLLPGTYYKYIVQTVCCDNIGTSPWSPVQYLKTLSPPSCSAPSSAQTSNISQTGATFTWSTVEGACSYKGVYYPLNNAGTSNTFATTYTSFTASGLLPNTSYHWVVQTVCCSGNTSTSYTGQYFKTIPSACTAPGKITVINLTQTTAKLSWDKVGGGCGYSVSYNIPGVTNLITVVTKDTSITLTSLVSHTGYHLYIHTVCCDGGLSSNLADINFTTLPTTTPCYPPRVYKLNSASQSGASVSWSKVDGACSYNLIYYSTATSASTTVNTKDTSYTFNHLLSGTGYYWVINTVCCNSNQGQNGPVQTFKTEPATSITCVPPRTPVNDHITLTGAQLTWNKVKNSCGYVVIWYAHNNTSVYNTIQTKDTTVTISGLQANSYYIWKVQTVCCATNPGTQGQSDFTPLIYFKTLAPPPAVCNAPLHPIDTNITQTSALLSWSPVENSCGYSGFYYRENNTASIKYFTTKSPSIHIDSLLPNTVYHWTVRTICCNPNSTDNTYSSYIPVLKFTTQNVSNVICNAPHVLKSCGVTQSTAAVRWNKVEHACSYILIYYPASNPSAYIYVTTKDTSSNIAGLNPNTLYNWKVKTVCCSATNINSTSDFSVIESFTTQQATQPVCTAPKELRSNDITPFSAKLVWNSVPNAYIYLIEYWPNDSVNLMIYVKSSDTTLTINGLVPFTNYKWKVKTYCQGDGSATGILSSSDWSAISDFSTLRRASNCTPPQTLVNVKIYQTSAILSWNSLPGVSNYIVQYSTVNGTVHQLTTKDTVITITGIIPNTKYEWHVKSLCCGPTSTTPCFESEPSIAQDFTTLQIFSHTCFSPTNLIVKGITQTGAVLTWNHAENACYYVVNYTSEITMQAGFLVIQTKDTSVTLSNLIANMKYDWKVKTICCPLIGGTYSESDFTALQTFATLAPTQHACNTPTGLGSGNITSSSSTLNWSHSESSCYYLIAYNPSKSTDPNEVKYVRTQDTNIVLTGLAANTAYTWKIKSYCCNSSGTVYGESSFSEIKTFTTLAAQFLTCNAPTDLASGDITSSAVTFKWGSVTNACVYLVILYSADTTTGITRYFRTITPTLRVDGLKSGTNYKWEVKTYCCGQTSSVTTGSPFSALQSFTTLSAPVIACNPPRHLTSDNITSNSASLDWNRVNNAPAYLVYIWTDSLHFKYWITSDTLNPVYGLRPASTYHWKAISICYNSASQANYSDFSAVQTFTTLPVPTVTCKAPSNLAASNINAHNATIGWTAAQYAQSYLIYYKPVKDTNSFKFEISQDPQYVLRGLFAKTDYIWKVKSICNASNFNGVNFSDFSQPAYFTTLSDTIRTGCNPPTNLTSTSITDSSAVLAWDSVLTAKLYIVLYSDAILKVMKYKITSSPDLPLGGLKPSTKYIWQTGIICNLNNMYAFSKLSDTASFVTSAKSGPKLDKSGNSSLSFNMTVYPNPTDGIIKVNISNASGNNTLMIYNIAGQAVYTDKISEISNYFTKEIDLSGYSKGVYFIKATNDIGVLTKKIIVH